MLPRRWLLASAPLWLATCVREPEPALPAGPPLAIEVEYAGCAEVRTGPVCDVAPGSKLVVWARALDATATLSAAIEGTGATTTATATAIEDGVRWKLVVPAGARAVVVRDAASSARVVIPLVHEPLPSELLEAERLRQSGKFADAEAMLAKLGDGGAGAARARVLAKRARLAMATGRSEKAIALFRQAIELDQANGLRSAEIDDRAALAYALIFQSERFSDADGVLRPLTALAREVPQARSTASYLQGLFANETGDLRTAATRGAEARVEALRLDLARERRAATLLEIDVLATLGQSERAMALIEELGAVADGLSNPCERAQAIHNVAFYRMEDAHTHGRPLTESTLHGFEKAVALTKTECPNQTKHVHYAAKLALALARMGRARDARAVLDDLPQPLEGSVLILSDAEVALALGDVPRALARFEMLRALGQESPHTLWYSWVGTGRAYLRSGDVSRAIDALRSAEDTLEGYAFLVPYGGGHSTFLDACAESARLLVDTLVASGRTDEAFAAARRARRRGLASLAWRARVESLARESKTRWYDALSDHRRQRARIDAEASEDWKLSADRLAIAMKTRRERLAKIKSDLEATFAQVAPLPGTSDADLPAVGAGELVLLAHDGARGAVLFAALDGKVTAVDVGVVDARATTEELSARLLGPLAPLVARASRVRVWSAGLLDRVDVHALLIDGVPLVARVPVVYGLDVVRVAAAAADGAHDVLIVADPRGDLAQAREEAQVVETAVVRAGGHARLLAGDLGTRDALVNELSSSSVELLHVASHAVYKGLDGWDSHIRLAHRGELTVADILTLDRVPPLVVLSGCETGRDEAGHATSLSLAHALLLSGATAVLATTRSVDDGQARQLMTAFYASPNFRDLPAALARAQAEIAARTSTPDWASFRVIVP